MRHQHCQRCKVHFPYTIFAFWHVAPGAQHVAPGAPARCAGGATPRAPWRRRGLSTEEVLYNIRDYDNTAEDLGIRLPAYIKIFLTLLDAGLRATVKNLIQDRVQGNFVDIAEDLTATPPVPAQTAWDQFKK